MGSNLGPLWAIVPASGLGRRMQSPIPKQYLQLCGKSILEHTLDRLLSFKHTRGVILVLRQGDQDWEALNYRSKKSLIIATGGEERQDSVFNGLLKLFEIEPDAPYVMIHDAVRPLVLHQDLVKLMEAARQNSAGAILGVPVNDTLKRQNGDTGISETIARDGLWRAFTPQLFRASLLLEAYNNVRAKKLQITDDAASVEALGMSPSLVESNVQNIKITNMQDLKLASQILMQQQGQN